MFATSNGSVRRNRLSDFVNVMSNGKIAMKLGEADHLVDVTVCNSNHDVLLSTGKGKCIRFPTTDVRLFAGRSSSGVRGIRLAPKDNVISMSTLKHVSFSIEERDGYLRRRRAERLENEDNVEEENISETPNSETIKLSDERYLEMVESDQFILTLASNGFGKRTSSYEYTVRKRGGQGIANIKLGSDLNNSVVGSFPVIDGDQLVIVTDNGQMIRTGIDEIRIAGRSTRGVIVFRVNDKEHVVSVSRLLEVEDDEPEAGASESSMIESEVEIPSTSNTQISAGQDTESDNEDA